MQSPLFKRINGTRRLVLPFALLVSAAFSGCTPVPLGAEKPVTMSLAPTDSSRLQLAEREAKLGYDSSLTSFAPLQDGNEALGARLRFIEAAQNSLDLQYFLMKPDLGGALIALSLIGAADRGVRVRLLLDDVFTTVDDHGLGLLNAHPNIDVRIFNPSMRPGSKSLGFVTEFSRINRRMHNKSFIADGTFAIVGGRNIADEYFQINTTSEFADFEMLVAGPAVEQISAYYDLYWNDDWSIPMEKLRKPPSQDELDDQRAEFEALMMSARQTYEKAVNDPFLERVIAGKELVLQGRTRVVADSPEKLKVPVPDGQRLVAEDLLRQIKHAKSEVWVLTPYFVPEDYGARLFAEVAQRGVKVRIVTNSLASNNHAYVHAGYRRHREMLLKAGVELYEVRADTLQVTGAVPEGDKTGVVMHTKMALIDGKDVFIGSLNFDPRSFKQNTEIGFFIDSPKIAGLIDESLHAGLATYTYRLELASDGEFEWHYDYPAAPSVTRKEPGASVWTNFVVGVTELLNVELQL